MATENTPFIDGPRPELDETRAARSLEYTATNVGPDEYDVVKLGDDQIYTVRTAPLNCDCGDAVYHNKICKHLIAALYAAGDDEAVRLCHELIDAMPEVREMRADYGIA